MTETTDQLDRERIEVVFRVLSALYVRYIGGSTPLTRSYSSVQLRQQTGIRSATVLRRILRGLYRRGAVTIDQPRFNPACDDYRWTINMQVLNHPKFKHLFDGLLSVRLFRHE